MSTLDVTRTYADGTLLYAADFDALCNESETFFNTTKLNGDNLAADGITASLKITDTSITTAKIPDSAITTLKLEDEAVTTAKINDLAVTTVKILDGTLVTADFTDGVVTYAKQASITISTTSSSGSFLNSGSADVTNLSQSFTTVGTRPVLVSIRPATSGVSIIGSPTQLVASLEVYRDSTLIAAYIGSSISKFNFSNILLVDDAGAQGTYIYKARINSFGSGGGLNVTNCILSVIQL